MKKRVWISGLALLLLLGLAGLLLYNGVFWLNNPSKAAYPVRGVDVSEFQGEIDWPTLAGQDLDFAFLKATEGSSYRDPRFLDNWVGANQTGLRVGAYHFFSFESAGATQAENFLSALCAAEEALAPKAANALSTMLPPAVDLELYGEFQQNPPPAEAVREELNALLQAIEARCGVRPLLYATGRARELYLGENYQQYGLWIRSVYTAPGVDGWVFWQYSHRGTLRGYSGPERFIDLNVFRGSEADFSRYGQS